LTSGTVPALIMGLKLRKPDLHTSSCSARTTTCFASCVTGSSMLRSWAFPRTQPDLESQVLFEDDVFFAAPAGSRHAEQREINLGACANEHFVSLSEGFVTYRGFMQAFGIAGFKPNVVMTTGDIFTLINLVSGGIGCTLSAGRVRSVLPANGAADPVAGEVPDAPEDRRVLPAHSASAIRTCWPCWRPAASRANPGRGRHPRAGP
jgi:LysR family malonate utilization transcriptional regulator